MTILVFLNLGNMKNIKLKDNTAIFRDYYHYINLNS